MTIQYSQVVELRRLDSFFPKRVLAPNACEPESIYYSLWIIRRSSNTIFRVCMCVYLQQIFIYDAVPLTHVNEALDIDPNRNNRSTLYHVYRLLGYTHMQLHSR